MRRDAKFERPDRRTVLVLFVGAWTGSAVAARAEEEPGSSRPATRRRKAEPTSPRLLAESETPKVERSEEIERLLKRVSSLKYVGSNGGYFDGGSGGEVFRRPDGKELVLFIPNPSYWSDHAITTRIQPLGFLIRHGDHESLIEIERDSPLEKRFLELISAELQRRERASESTTRLRTIQDLIRERSVGRKFEEDLKRWKK